MCDYFWQRMDQNNQGDLTDIFRNSSHPATDTWHLLPEPPAAACPPPSNVFGDPFADIGDPPPIYELAAANFFNPSAAAIATASSTARGDDGGARKMLLGEEGKGSIFSRMLQISPAVTAGKMSAEMGPSPLGAAAVCGDGLQISSTRVQGIKRRKSQVKKVVCIPAPAAASGRPSGTGEVVPSDLWAWRKYGQKPIKGSPYPRGYYRCSSSKGCSARKQVERSRTDPNMLVITYSSEHNHPWPTQRNALAGSTRSQSSKANNNGASTSKNSARSLSQSKSVKEEQKECSSSTVQFQDADFDQVFDDGAFMMTAGSKRADDFFADLAELESSDPMSLIFPKGFVGDHDKFDWEGGL